MVQLHVINSHADISPFSLQISSIDAEWSRLVCQIQTLPRSDQMKPTYDQKLLGMCADAQAGVEMETRVCRHSVHVLRGPTRSQRYLHAIHQPWHPRSTSPAAQTHQESSQYRWVHACTVISQSWSGYTHMHNQSAKLRFACGKRLSSWLPQRAAHPLSGHCHWWGARTDARGCCCCRSSRSQPLEAPFQSCQSEGYFGVGDGRAQQCGATRFLSIH